MTRISKAQAELVKRLAVKVAELRDRAEVLELDEVAYHLNLSVELLNAAANNQEGPVFDRE